MLPHETTEGDYLFWLRSDYPECTNDEVLSSVFSCGLSVPSFQFTFFVMLRLKHSAEQIKQLLLQRYGNVFFDTCILENGRAMFFACLNYKTIYIHISHFTSLLPLYYILLVIFVYSHIAPYRTAINRYKIDNTGEKSARLSERTEIPDVVYYVSTSTIC